VYSSEFCAILEVLLKTWQAQKPTTICRFNEVFQSGKVPSHSFRLLNSSLKYKNTTVKSIVSKIIVLLQSGNNNSF
jgi:hypothetical protein